MFLSSDYNDLLSPDPEDGAEKTGASAFVNIIARNCVALLKVNLLFLLGCVPVVTIPVSLFALNRAVRQMMLDRPVRCLPLFAETFRRGWKRGYLAFGVTAVPLWCAWFGLRVYLNFAAANPVFFAPFLVCSTLFLVVLLSAGCLYGLMDCGRDFKDVLRLALLMGVARPLRTAPAVLLAGAVLGMSVIAFPLSGLYLLLLGFSLPCLIVNFFLRTLLNPFAPEDEDE